MSALDEKIDVLYTLPLGEFTAARNALAKSLKADEARRVKALEKPTVVAWAVNQVYWRARGTYDRLMKSGEKLRAAQIAALEGRAADVRGTGDAHRRAIGEAVAEAERLSAVPGAKPGADALTRTFESLSLASTPPAQPGRLTEILQPAGFEALAGVTNITVRTGHLELSTPNVERRMRNAERRTPNDERPTRAAAAEAKEAACAEAERNQREAAVKEAEAKLARAEMTERAARESWERAHDALIAARQTLADVKRSRP